jgi:hypothetical protein
MVLVSKQAPDFTAPAVLGNGTFFIRSILLLSALPN